MHFVLSSEKVLSRCTHLDNLGGAKFVMPIWYRLNRQHRVCTSFDRALPLFEAWCRCCWLYPCTRHHRMQDCFLRCFRFITFSCLRTDLLQPSGTDYVKFFICFFVLAALEDVNSFCWLLDCRAYRLSSLLCQIFDRCMATLSLDTLYDRFHEFEDWSGLSNMLFLQLIQTLVAALTSMQASIPLR